jgi:Na+/alanine symporter
LCIQPNKDVTAAKSQVPVDLHVRYRIGTYILGVLLHFFIALSAATIYYAASRRLGFLTEHPLVCGLFFGMAVDLVMNLVVLPLSAHHARGPYKLHDLILGLLVHMVVIGLPISFSVRRFAK